MPPKHLVLWNGGMFVYLFCIAVGSWCDTIRFFISNSLGRPSHSTGVAYMHKCKALHGVFENRSFVMMLYKREMLLDTEIFAIPQYWTLRCVASVLEDDEMSIPVICTWWQNTRITIIIQLRNKYIVYRASFQEKTWASRGYSGGLELTTSKSSSWLYTCLCSSHS